MGIGEGCPCPARLIPTNGERYTARFLGRIFPSIRFDCTRVACPAKTLDRILKYLRDRVERVFFSFFSLGSSKSYLFIVRAIVPPFPCARIRRKIKFIETRSVYLPSPHPVPGPGDKVEKRNAVFARAFPLAESEERNCYALHRK